MQQRASNGHAALAPTAVALVLLAIATATGCDSCGKMGSDASSGSVAPMGSVAALVAPPDGSAHSESSSDAGESSAVGLVSLLAWTDARVAVSSTVDNPHDFPEHLIDRDPDTAWNSRTGDLAGFILFRIPKDAHVDRIRITAGFDHVGKDGRDLFTANHRIKRVRIARDGLTLKEVALDVKRRDLQSIAIDSPGGDYQISVLETVAGSNTAWRELVVSELEVLGDPGVARLAKAHTPRVRVGALDDRPVTPDAHANEPDTIDAYCKWFVQTNESAVHAAFTDPAYPCNDANAHATCDASEAQALRTTGAFVALETLSTADAKDETRDLIVVGKKGQFARVGGESNGRCELGDPGTSHSTLVSVEEKKLANGDAVVIVVTDRIDDAPMYSDPDTGEPRMWLQFNAKRSLVLCHAKPDAAPACDPPRTLGEFTGPAPSDGSPPPFDVWSERKAYKLGVNGVLKLTDLPQLPTRALIRTPTLPP